MKEAACAKNTNYSSGMNSQQDTVSHCADTHEMTPEICFSFSTPSLPTTMFLPSNAAPVMMLLRASEHKQM
jgi:hypothetical protein